MLYNDYRHASPPARSESWGVVDVQVDFTGLAFISSHRSSPERVRQCTPKVSEAVTDQSRSEVGAEHTCSRNELAQQLFKTEDLLRPGWATPRRPWLLGSQQRSRARDACRRPLERLDRSEVRTATRIRDLANGSSNRHSACEFPQFKGAGFRTHRHVGRLAGHAGDP